MKTLQNLLLIIVCAVAAVALCDRSPAAAANRGQGVTADRLPEELRLLTVEKRFVPGAGETVGTVRTVRGHLVVRHGESREAYFAAAGDALFANDELFTLEASRCRVVFTTADIVDMGANSHISVDELVDNRQERQKKSRLSMLRGKAMFFIMRLIKYDKVDTEVRTPTAVCGVRGTKFGVIVQEKTGLLSMKTPLYLADASEVPPVGLLAANGDGNTQTTVVTYDGEVMVFSSRDGSRQNVGPGQSVTVGPTGAGAVGPVDPALGQNLENETNPDAGGTGGGGDSGGQGGGNTPYTGSGSDTAGDGDQSGSDQISSVTQQSLQSGRPAKRIGYFAGMLTRLSYYGSPISPTPDNVYVSPSLHDYEAPGIIGTAIENGSDILEMDGAPDATPTVVEVDTNTGTDLDTTNGLGSQHRVKESEVGYNQFLEWGYWIIDVEMTHSSGEVGTWVFDNSGVYVHGDPTPVENLNGITGHYTGTAWGTLWGNAGTPGILMKNGTMSADVALGSTILRNLDVYVSDGGANWVSIQQNADAYFNPTEGTASLDSENTSVTIKGNPATTMSGSVGLFGPNGEAMGGVVGARSTSEITSDRAVVGFEGTKQ